MIKFDKTETSGAELVPYFIGSAPRNIWTKFPTLYMDVIVVRVDITAPLYWWNLFYDCNANNKANACFMKYEVDDRPFTLNDFSHEHLISGEMGDINRLGYFDSNNIYWDSSSMLESTIDMLNFYHELYLRTKEKQYWRQLILLLPACYNQRQTVKFSYGVLSDIYRKAKNNELDEWRDFCEWIKSLPHSEIITLEGSGDNGLKAKITCADEFTTQGE